MERGRERCFVSRWIVWVRSTGGASRYHRVPQHKASARNVNEVNEPFSYFIIVWFAELSRYVGHIDGTQVPYKWHWLLVFIYEMAQIRRWQRMGHKPRGICPDDVVMIGSTLSERWCCMRLRCSSRIIVFIKPFRLTLELLSIGRSIHCNHRLSRFWIAQPE